MFAEVMEIVARGRPQPMPAEMASFGKRQFPREKSVAPEIGNGALPRFLHKNDLDHYAVEKEGALMRKSLERDLRKPHRWHGEEPIEC